MSVPHENLIIDCPVLSDAAPVVLGGIGGSGTRVVTQLLQSLGFDMGSDLNQSLDELGFTALFKRPSLWPLEDHLSQLNEALDVYLASRGHKSESWTSQAHHGVRVTELLNSTSSKGEWIDTGSLAERQKCLATPSQPTSLWGWKEPNTHIPLPFLIAALPKMKYIHVTRHGLDMAHSSNQTQMKIWGPHLLRRPVQTGSASDSLAFWCVAHGRLMRLGKIADTQILVLPFERLFDNPSCTLKSLCNFLGQPKALTTALAAISSVQKPQTIGRYRNRAPLKVALNQKEILMNLGYRVENLYN